MVDGSIAVAARARGFCWGKGRCSSLGSSRHTLRLRAAMVSRAADQSCVNREIGGSLATHTHDEPMATPLIVRTLSRIGSTIGHRRHRNLPFFIATIAQRDDGFDYVSTYRAWRANGAVGWPLGEECNAIRRVHRSFPIWQPEVANGRQIPAIARGSRAGKKNALVLHLSDS